MTDRRELMLDELAQAAFKMNFAEVGADGNAARRGWRLRHLAGVAMKRDFSTVKHEAPAPHAAGWAVHAKWLVDPDRLGALPDDHWALAVLRSVDDAEDPRALALTIRRETRFAQWLAAFGHSVCCGRDARAAAEKGIGAGGKALQGVLSDHGPGVGEAVEIVAVIAANYGLERFCRWAARCAKARGAGALRRAEKRSSGKASGTKASGK